MHDGIYRSLQEKIDTYSFGFPATRSGVELEILRHFFPGEQAEVALNLNPLPESIETIAGRMNRDPDELLGILADMVQKGTVFNTLSPDGEMCFHAAPFMHGFAENNAGRMDAGLANLLEQYEKDGYLDHFASMPTEAFIRFVPVNESLTPEMTVAPYNDVEDLLKSKQRIAAVPCLCREKGQLLGEKVDLPVHNVCFSFDWYADYVVERGQGKYLSLDEALVIQKQCETAGLVNLPANFDTPMVLCHCDGKFCIGLRALKTLPKPAQHVACDYFMAVHEEECTGCDVCLDICPMEAIADTGSGIVDINLDRCIGCGVCVSTCPMEALVLQEKPETEKPRKPITPTEFVSEISKRRGKQASPLLPSDHQAI